MCRSAVDGGKLRDVGCAGHSSGMCCYGRGEGQTGGVEMLWESGRGNGREADGVLLLPYFSWA